LRSLPFKGKDSLRIFDAAPGSPRRQTGPKMSSANSGPSNLPPLALTSSVEKNGSQSESESSRSSRALRAEQRRFQTELNSQDWVPGNLLQFNPLSSRQKKLHLGRSGIHAMGVYALEPIKANDFVIEYIGELVRPSVAELREKIYDKIDVGGSYLFRIDNEVVIDATFKGNLARFINHSCEPNCFTKVISVGQSKHVVIYAKRDIQIGEELAYDYKFPFEDDHMKVPCTCGKPKCRITLN
jgi:histone-lysine N-methyltransferase SETD1